MPTVVAHVEIDIWCGTCGKGLCNHASARGSAITVDACPFCIDEKEVKISELCDEVGALEWELERLKSELKEAL